MRVAHLMRPAEGGMRQQVRSLLTDPDVETLLAAPPSVLVSLADATTCPLFPLPDTDGLLTQLRGGRTAGRWLATTGAQVVHGHGLRRVPLYALAARSAGLPLVVTLHNLVPRLSLAQRLLLQLCLYRTEVIAVSHAVARSYGRRSTVIHNGIDTHRYDLPPTRSEARVKLGIDEGTFVALCLARLSPEKGIDVLINAKTDALVLIAGDGPDWAALAASAGENVRLLGYRHDLADLFAAADLYVQPSREEGLGLAILEAMSAGLPIVASAVGGIPELLPDTRYGVLVPPGDSVALATAINALQHDSERRQRLGSAARERAEAHFSLDVMRLATREIYQKARR